MCLCRVCPTPNDHVENFGGVDGTTLESRTAFRRSDNEARAIGWLLAWNGHDDRIGHGAARGTERLAVDNECWGDVNNGIARRKGQRIQRQTPLDSSSILELGLVSPHFIREYLHQLVGVERLAFRVPTMAFARAKLTMLRIGEQRGIQLRVQQLVATGSTPLDRQSHVPALVYAGNGGVFGACRAATREFAWVASFFLRRSLRALAFEKHSARQRPREFGSLIVDGAIPFARLNTRRSA